MAKKIGFRAVMLVGGMLACFAATATASDAIGVYVDGRPLPGGAEARLSEEGVALAPVRDLAESLGARVAWDDATRSVRIRTSVNTSEVKEWIVRQGKEKDPTAYYWDGLSVTQANVDRDPEPEVLAKIDGGVHLGQLFLFDKQPDDTYKLVAEEPWHVESWNLTPLNVDRPTPFYEIVTRTGGTGVDVREAHLMYMNDAGEWTEAWKGTLKDRMAFQDQYRVPMGSYQLNDDNGQLFYWQTETVAPIDDDRAVRNPNTKLHVFEFKDGRFTEKSVD